MTIVNVLVQVVAEPPEPPCAGRRYKFTAMFKPVEIEGPHPPPRSLEWTIDGVADPELTEKNPIEIPFFEAGHHRVDAQEHGTAFANVTVIDDAGGIEIVEVHPEMTQGETRLAISAEPRMPEITAVARIVKGVPTSGISWTGFITFDPKSDCPPAQRENMRFDLPQTTGDQVTLDFGGKIRGGFLTFFAHATFDSLCGPDDRDAFEGPVIDGTNPFRTDVEEALPNNTLRAIACRESGQRQFSAPPDGGVGPCPLFNMDGTRVGLMQIPNATDDEVWDWKLNARRGIELFEKSFAEAEKYPSDVRGSAVFEHLVKEFNDQRSAQGVQPIDITLPDIPPGDFDNNLGLLELDAIRGYNGREGQDEFGFELHEFRVGMDLIDGKEVLRVRNVDEETGTGEAQWERVPVGVRPSTSSDPHYDPNYVNSVLVHLGTPCAPKTGVLPSLPVVTVDVHPNDAKTHRFNSVLPAVTGIPSHPTAFVHFVTVKGSGDLILQAKLNPDTTDFRNKLTWKAEGATITSPAVGSDRLTAKISREVAEGKRILVKVKIGNRICSQVLVWIISCTLKARRRGLSTIPDPNTGKAFPLGLQTGNTARTLDSYGPQAGIEWTATIFPKRLITDLDRPSIDNQVPQNVPADGGVPGAGSAGNDATGSSFVGWDISQQRRNKAFKGNPDKQPPEPLIQTSTNDPDPFFHPVPNFPSNDTEGNDDSPDATQDEDCNPYEQANKTVTSPPGHGEVGTLRHADRPRLPELLDGLDFNGVAPGEDGDTIQLRAHFRVFVRVQLEDTWYRCSDFGLWRYHVNAKRRNGKWMSEPGHRDELKLDNDGF